MKRYRTIVADPPWPISWPARVSAPTDRARGRQFVKALSYQTMSLPEINALPVADLADDDAHLYLWTTGLFLASAFATVETWGFRYSQVLTWCKAPMGLFAGGAFQPSAEYAIFARRGSLKPLRRVDTCWWNWPRTTHSHSSKPEAFLDLVESVSPGPRIEMFARRNRLGWDTWGNEALEHVFIEEGTP